MSITKILNQDIVMAFVRNPSYQDNLLFDRNTQSFYLYNNIYYILYSELDMTKEVNNFVLANFPTVNISPNLIRDLIKMISWHCFRQVNELDSPYVALQDKLLNTNTFDFEDFDRDKIATNLLNFSSAQLYETTCPKWDKFLSEILLDKNHQTDPDLILFMQEVFGYYLSNTLKAHASVFLIGEGRNGKSVLLSILAAMIGQENVTALSIEALTVDKFAAVDLIGKKVNICNEEESKFLKPDKFKSLISGDSMRAQRKFKDSFMFTPRCKHIFATNVPPTFEGLNKGLIERIFLVPFTRYFKLEERNFDLKEELLQELPAILAWSIVGGKRLIANNYKISKPQALVTTSQDFAESISAGIRYISESWQMSQSRRDFTEDWVAKTVLYEEYVKWCESNGRNEMNSANFFRDLKSHFEGYEERGRRVNGLPARCVNFERVKENQMQLDDDDIIILSDDLNLDKLNFNN